MKPFIPGLVKSSFIFFLPKRITSRFKHALQEYPVEMRGLWMPKKFNLYTELIQ